MGRAQNDHDNVPDFWLSTYEDVNRFLGENVKKGRVSCLGRSAGGRAVWSVSYGEFRRPPAKTNFSAALGAGDMGTFFGPPSDDETPILFIVCGTHGGEMEGVVGALNLLSILESGKDLRGREWAELKATAERLRLVILPLHNPDGRARVKPKSLAGMEFEEFRYWCQGAWKSGELIGYPECKQFQPLPAEDVAFLGGYPNDDGYNIMHDVHVTGSKTREAKALLQLVEEERPDLVYHVHSCELGPFLLIGEQALPEGHRDVQFEMQRRFFRRWEKEGLRPSGKAEAKTRKRPDFNLGMACYAASGAVTVTFEGPHGLKMNPYTYDEILDCHLVGYEELMRAMLDIPVFSRRLLEE